MSVCMALMFAENVVMTSHCAELVVLWCEWLQFTLIGLPSTECVTFIYVLEFTYHRPPSSLL